MISDRLFVYGTLMRGFDHPMAQLLSRSADFLGEATCRGRLYLIKHYPGLVLSDDPAEVVFGELYRLRDRDAERQTSRLWKPLRATLASLRSGLALFRQGCQ